MSTPSLRWHILQRLLKRRRLGTLTGALFPEWLTCLFNVTRFSLDLWIRFFCRSMGAPIPMLQAQNVARTMCSCKNFSLDPKGDHVLA